jgi:hypothetical protein
VITVIDDGVCALTYDSYNSGVVIKDHTAPGENRLGYEVFGVVCWVAPKVARLLGFKGYMSLRHMCLLAQLLRQLGYETAYRKNDVLQHRPWGELVTAGFWAGEVHMDVKRLPRCLP